MTAAPSIVAWSSKEELEKLKSWFYHSQPSPDLGEPSLDFRQRAIYRVPSSKIPKLIAGSSIPNTLSKSPP